MKAAVSKLKIAVIIDQLLAGGVQLAAIEQVKELNKLGHQAQLVILMRKKYPIDFSYLTAHVSHEYLSDRYPQFIRHSFKFPFFSFLSTLHLLGPFLASHAFKKEDYDMFVSWGTTTCLTTKAISRAVDIPYIAIIHDPIEYILDKVYKHSALRYIFFLLKPLARYFEGSFVSEAEQTLIISKVHRTYIIDHYGVEPTLLYFGTKSLSQLPPSRGGTILSFGRWQKEKHPEILLTLAKQNPKAQLVIAGNWIRQEELKQFRKRIANENLEMRVKLIPHFDDTELVKLCNNARMFIHPHFETFGLAALEAAAHGLPIIIPQRSGVTEYFTHGVHGYFPKKVTAQAFQKPIATLLKNEIKAHRMGEKAWEVVKKQFSWTANTKKLLGVIQEALRQRNKPEIVVLEIGHALGTQLSGGDKLMEPMARNLVSQYRFTVVVPQIGAHHWQQSPISKQLLILASNRFDDRGTPLPVFFSYCIRMITTCRMLFARKYRKDTLLYSSTNQLPDVLPAFFVSKLKRVRWVARIHHLIPPPHKRKGIWVVNVVSYLMQILSLAMIKKQADLILVLNVKLKLQLKEKHFPPSKLTVLGAGIDYKTIAKTPVDPKITQYQGIYVGRLHPSKGLFDLVPIWKGVLKHDASAKLAIIGTGDINYKNFLKKMILKEKLEKKIVVLGYVTTDNLYQLLKRAKVFLFTDHEAGWGIAAAEAMAAKLPIVGYDIGVLGTVYKKGYRMVPLGDTEGMTNELITLLSNEKKRQQLAQAAHQEAQRFDWKPTSYHFTTLLSRLQTPNNQ